MAFISAVNFVLNLDEKLAPLCYLLKIRVNFTFFELIVKEKIFP